MTGPGKAARQLTTRVKTPVEDSASLCGIFSRQTYLTGIWICYTPYCIWGGIYKFKIRERTKPTDREMTTPSGGQTADHRHEYLSWFR